MTRGEGGTNSEGVLPSAMMRRGRKIAKVAMARRLVVAVYWMWRKGITSSPRVRSAIAIMINCETPREEERTHESMHS